VQICNHRIATLMNSTRFFRIAVLFIKPR